MDTVASLPHHAPARIVAVGGDRGYRRRLMELGFLPGVEVIVHGAAPLGDPLDVEVRGCRFSLRRAEADIIAVAPAAGETAQRAPA